MYEWKMVPGRADRNHVAFLYGFVHGAGSPSAGIIFKHGNMVSSRFARGIAERVLTRHPAWQMNVYVGTRRK